MWLDLLPQAFAALLGGTLLWLAMRAAFPREVHYAEGTQTDAASDDPSLPAGVERLPADRAVRARSLWEGQSSGGAPVSGPQLVRAGAVMAVPFVTRCYRCGESFFQAPGEIRAICPPCRGEATQC